MSKVAMQLAHRRVVVTRLDVVDEYGNLGTPAHRQGADAITHPESARFVAGTGATQPTTKSDGRSRSAVQCGLAAGSTAALQLKTELANVAGPDHGSPVRAMTRLATVHGSRVMGSGQVGWGSSLGHASMDAVRTYLIGVAPWWATRPVPVSSLCHWCRWGRKCVPHFVQRMAASVRVLWAAQMRRGHWHTAAILLRLLVVVVGGASVWG